MKTDAMIPYMSNSYLLPERWVSSYTVLPYLKATFTDLVLIENPPVDQIRHFHFLPDSE